MLGAPASMQPWYNTSNLGAGIADDTAGAMWQLELE
jgi:hypothetical protein